MVDWPSVWTGSPQLAASCRLSSCVSFSTNTPLCPFIDCCVCVYFFCLCTLFFVLLVFSFFFFFILESLSLRLPPRGLRGGLFSLRAVALFSCPSGVRNSCMYTQKWTIKNKERKKQTNSGRRTDAKWQDDREGERKTKKEREQWWSVTKTSTKKPTH